MIIYKKVNIENLKNFELYYTSYRAVLIHYKNQKFLNRWYNLKDWNSFRKRKKEEPLSAR